MIPFKHSLTPRAIIKKDSEDNRVCFQQPYSTEEGERSPTPAQ